MFCYSFSVAGLGKQMTNCLREAQTLSNTPLFLHGPDGSRKEILRGIDQRRIIRPSAEMSKRY